MSILGVTYYLTRIIIIIIMESSLRVLEQRQAWQSSLLPELEPVHLEKTWRRWGLQSSIYCCFHPVAFCMGILNSTTTKAAPWRSVPRHLPVHRLLWPFIINGLHPEKFCWGLIVRAPPLQSLPALPSVHRAFARLAVLFAV